MGDGDWQQQLESCCETLLGVEWTAKPCGAERLTVLFKLVLIGESGVGKTSVFMRVKDGVFRSEATLGVESYTADVSVDGFRIKLAIWDTAGVERFRTLTRNYYRHCHCALLTCSVDDKTSLDNLHRWNQDVDFYCKECVKVVLVNKTDLPRDISPEQLQNFASTFDCKLITSVSAKTGEGVQEMLADVARLLVGAHHLQSKAPQPLTSDVKRLQPATKQLGRRSSDPQQQQQQQQQQQSKQRHCCEIA